MFVLSHVRPVYILHTQQQRPGSCPFAELHLSASGLQVLVEAQLTASRSPEAVAVSAEQRQLWRSVGWWLQAGPEVCSHTSVTTLSVSKTVLFTPALSSAGQQVIATTRRHLLGT